MWNPTADATTGKTSFTQQKEGKEKRKLRKERKGKEKKRTEKKKKRREEKERKERKEKERKEKKRKGKERKEKKRKEKKRGHKTGLKLRLGASTPRRILRNSLRIEILLMLEAKFTAIKSNASSVLTEEPTFYESRT